MKLTKFIDNTTFLGDKARVKIKEINQGNKTIVTYKTFSIKEYVSIIT